MCHTATPLTDLVDSGALTRSVLSCIIRGTVVLFLLIIVDIDTGLMICNASHENIFRGELNVSGKPSERQLTNCWIHAPPLGDSDHVTPKRLAVLIWWSLGAEVFFRCSSDRTSTCYHRLCTALYLHLSYFIFFIRLIASSLDAPDIQLSSTH